MSDRQPCNYQHLATLKWCSKEKSHGGPCTFDGEPPSPGEPKYCYMCNPEIRGEYRCLKHRLEPIASSPGEPEPITQAIRNYGDACERVGKLAYLGAINLAYKDAAKEHDEARRKLDAVIAAQPSPGEPTMGDAPEDRPNCDSRTDIDAAPPGYVGLTEPFWKRRARLWKQAAHAQNDLFRAVDGNRIAAEREIVRLEARLASPPLPSREPTPEMVTIQKMAAQHAHRWLGRDGGYWLFRLMQEVGELASVMAGDHPDTVEHELTQIGSICVNWLRFRAALVAGQPDNNYARQVDVRKFVMVWCSWATERTISGNFGSGWTVGETLHDLAASWPDVPQKWKDAELQALKAQRKDGAAPPTDTGEPTCDCEPPDRMGPSLECTYPDCPYGEWEKKQAGEPRKDGENG